MKNTSTEIAPAGQVCLQTSSPIGVLEITGSTAGIRSVRRVETDSVVIASGLPQDHPVAVCARQLSEYFSGDRREFDLLMDWSGKPVFFRKVWTEMLKIPVWEHRLLLRHGRKSGQSEGGQSRRHG
jgi:O6-methylguanine-DNA--protein-cysteine methyltransferase